MAYDGYRCIVWLMVATYVLYGLWWLQMYCMANGGYRCIVWLMMATDVLYGLWWLQTAYGNFSADRQAGRQTTPVTVYYVLYTVYSIMNTVYCILYNVYCILYTVYCIQYTIYCILYTVYCLVYNVYCSQAGSPMIYQADFLTSDCSFFLLQGLGLALE